MRIRLRPLLFVAGALALRTLPAAPPDPAADERRLAETVAAVLRADYRGDRAELARLAEALRALPAGRTGAFREYWTGFAHWRRAYAGFNEVPPAPDLAVDLARCAEHQRAALALDGAFEDARSALAGCLAGQLAPAAGLAPEKRKKLLEEGITVLEKVRARAEGNPRSLWIVGGMEAYGASQRNGDGAARALATYRRGLAAARAEALSAAGRQPWVPAWGTPELLMSLAWAYANGPAPNREVARAYAEAALAMVPDWRYVRDVLVPQIEKLPEPVSAPPPPTPSAP